MCVCVSGRWCACVSVCQVGGTKHMIVLAVLWHGYLLHTHSPYSVSKLNVAVSVTLNFHDALCVCAIGRYCVSGRF